MPTRDPLCHFRPRRLFSYISPGIQQTPLVTDYGCPGEKYCTQTAALAANRSLTDFYGLQFGSCLCTDVSSTSGQSDIRVTAADTGDCDGIMVMTVPCDYL